MSDNGGWTGQNVFKDFSYRSWAPIGMQELYLELENAIVQLETSLNLEAALSLFWKTLEFSYLALSMLKMAPPELREFLVRYVPEGEMKRLLREQLEATSDILMDDALRQMKGEWLGKLSQVVHRLKPIVPPDGSLKEFDIRLFAHVLTRRKT